MLGDDGWRFCEAGELLERAIITSHAVVSISRSLVRPPLATEIQLSAFLRLLGTRDAYRRVYQMRAEPAPVIELLFQHPEGPRSVLRCLTGCAELLRKSAAPGQAGRDDDAERNRIADPPDQADRLERATAAYRSSRLRRARGKGGRWRGSRRYLPQLSGFDIGIHHLISDGFLSHQAFIAESVQPMLLG